MTRAEYLRLVQIRDQTRDIKTSIALEAFLNEVYHKHEKRWLHSGHHRVPFNDPAPDDKPPTFSGVRRGSEGEEDSATQGNEPGVVTTTRP